MTRGSIRTDATLDISNRSLTGTTTVNAGPLLINGSTASACAVIVNENGTLGGTGTISGSVTVAGTLSPQPPLCSSAHSSCSAAVVK